MLASCRYHVDFMLAFARQTNQVIPNFLTLRFMALADPSPVNIFLRHSTHVGHFVGHFRLIHILIYYLSIIYDNLYESRRDHFKNT